MTNLRKLISRCNEMDITEQLNWLGDPFMPMEARKELDKLLALATQAHTKLNATQYNWQEQCLFECDDALEEIIRILSEARKHDRCLP